MVLKDLSVGDLIIDDDGKEFLIIHTELDPSGGEIAIFGLTHPRQTLAEFARNGLLADTNVGQLVYVIGTVADEYRMASSQSLNEQLTYGSQKIKISNNLIAKAIYLGAMRAEFRLQRDFERAHEFEKAIHALISKKRVALLYYVELAARLAQDRPSHSLGNEDMLTAELN